MAKFKTRARTVDLLGRQQIAGIPTAISELFKNAHDAYADNALVDYFRSDGLFVLRDDGVGMTRDDFENRWLTIGTESKVSDQTQTPPPYTPKDKNKRITMGEKGIGRLAIGLIGNQVLVLTRAKRDDDLSDLVAVFINWQLFEIPGINIDDIEIPIKVFPGDTLPDAEDISSMVQTVHQNLISLSNRVPSQTLQKIEQELKTFHVDPNEIESFAPGPSLKGNGHGTHFYILPSNDTIPLDIDEDQRRGHDPVFTKFLLGFADTMTTSKPPALTTEFRDWATDTPNDFTALIGPGEFITHDEFKMADHHIEGSFDEYGQFSGEVTVYGNEPVNHVVSWGKSHGVKTSCGPFALKLAHFQGAGRESTLAPDDYTKIMQKLERIGGVYVYRDGIRVLPYGNHDQDFLDIERNRTKSASYYYWSHRKMAGAIILSHAQNDNLVEKAGREGFLQNKAYRQLSDILKNFLLQTAADFFREGGIKAGDFIQIRKELNKQDAALRKKARQAKAKREKFSSDLNSFFQKIDTASYNDELESITDDIQDSLERAKLQKDPDQAADLLIRSEKNAKTKLSNIRAAYSISKPTGIGLTKQLERDWKAFLTEQHRLEEEHFRPTESRISQLLGEAASQAKIYIDQRKRLESLIKQASEKTYQEIQSKAKETRTSLKETEHNIQDMVKNSITAVADLIEAIQVDFNRTSFDDMDMSSVDEFRDSVEQKLSDAASDHGEVLSGIKQQLDVIQFERDKAGNFISQSDMMAAQESELIALQEDATANFELAQLGMAVDIINHEFTSSIQTIRRNVAMLKNWADINSELQPLYQDIRNSFEHLDGYLSLFTPLNRRLYRKEVEISGKKIFKFLQNLFQERCKRHHVEIIATDAFLDTAIQSYPSTFYPVFVNLIDNAIFWMRDTTSKKQITLDGFDFSFSVTDNGPGIPARDYDAIFDKGFSRKPAGRGLGLFISRSILKKAGYTLKLDTNTKSGTRFIIQPLG